MVPTSPFKFGLEVTRQGEMLFSFMAFLKRHI